MASEDDVNPYRKAPKGETADARKQRQTKYYSYQREQAQERGDQARVNKIYGKLGKKAPNVDTERGNKAILAAAPFAGMGALGLSRLFGSGAARAAGGAVGGALSKVGSKGSAVAKRAGSAAEKDVRSGAPGTSRALPSAQKALPSAGRKALTGPARKALPKPKPVSEKAVQPNKVKAGSARAKGESPRGKGEHPRAKGTNPRTQRKKASASE